MVNLLSKDASASDDDIEKFVEVGSGMSFDRSSDYQQDKMLSSWGQSPQARSTYQLTGVTNYVHIICMESCGLPTEPSGHFLNLVYIRDERVGGSISSEDTLSTIAEALLGR